MKALTRNTGTLRVIKRLPSSANGNPRYLCEIDGWTCRTTPDSNLGYSITNLDGKRVDAILGTYYGNCSIQSVNLAS